MTLLFIRLFDRSNSEAFPEKQVPLNQPNSGEEVERRHQPVVKRLREVRADYNLERRIFF
ncbi:MAG: hypothetical protein KME11_19100 [Timaviella obliquedivisa GSE-PSE-MK23-08B]|jgi:hypothetical protein|nr:hypothetical protein [Timaviella obliquedivisa GSE-PSE-MK23-08B]